MAPARGGPGTATHADFVARQKDYWQAVDEPHYRWQTEGALIAAAEDQLLAAIVYAPGERVLEIGCGEGANLTHLRKRYPQTRFAGIDFSPPKAAFVAGTLGLPALAADAAALPFPDGAFDAVLIRDLLHHVPDRVRTLVEALRVLRPGGRVHVLEPNGRNPIIAAMALAIPAERGMLASSAARTEAELGQAGAVRLHAEHHQPMPIARTVLHYRLGAPRLAGRPRVARGLLRLERAAARLPPEMWSYHLVRGRKS